MRRGYGRGGSRSLKLRFGRRYISIVLGDPIGIRRDRTQFSTETNPHDLGALRGADLGQPGVELRSAVVSSLHAISLMVSSGNVADAISRLAALILLLEPEPGVVVAH
jgi:hypothetical protein